MELKGASYLYTLATLMVTFAGFAALLLIIRQGAGAQISALDRFHYPNDCRTLVHLYGWSAEPSALELLRNTRGLDLEGVRFDIWTSHAGDPVDLSAPAQSGVCQTGSDVSTGNMGWTGLLQHRSNDRVCIRRFRISGGSVHVRPDNQLSGDCFLDFGWGWTLS